MPWLLSLVTGLASGVLFRSFNSAPWSLYLFLVTLVVILVGAHICMPRPSYLLGALVCISMVCGMLRTSSFDQTHTDLDTHLNARVQYTGTVIRDPDIREKSQRVTIRIVDRDADVTVLAVAPHQPVVAVGDRVSVAGRLTLPAPFETDGGRTFAYDRYLQKDGVSYLLNVARITPLSPAPWYSIPAALARVKHLFLSGLGATLPDQNAALAGGIVIGGKTGLAKDLQQAFIMSGLVHVIVLSGYNVTIVAEWMMTILAYLTTSRRARALAGALALLLFVGIAGFSATAVRATLMALIALYARATGRTYAASRALVVAVIVMLLWNPLYLAFDPGFGLSVAATAGLLWLSPLIEQWFIKTRIRLGRQEPNRAQRFWIEAVSSTLAAQVGVLPLLLYNTGNVSLVALPANLLVVAVMPLAMAVSAVAGIGGALLSSTSPSIAAVLAAPAHFITSYTILVAQKSAALPGATLTINAFSFWWVVAAYAALIAIAWSKRASMTDQLRLAKNAST